MSDTPNYKNTTSITEEQMEEDARRQLAESYHKQRKSRRIKWFIFLFLVCASIIGFFAGVEWYRDQANRAACLVNQHSIERVFDSVQGVSTISIDFSNINELWQHTGSSSGPSCPSGGEYILGSSVNAIYSGKEPCVRCTYEGHRH